MKEIAKMNWTAPKGYKRAVLVFDGVMSQPVVSVNGKEAGRWAYGYNAFRIDITPFIQFGKSNLIEVHLNNGEQRKAAVGILVAVFTVRFP